MRKVGLTAAVLATLALTLSGCGKESTANNTANNESLIDTYQDIVNYGIIAQLVERDLWKK